MPYIYRSRHLHMDSYYPQKGMTEDISSLFEELKAHGMTVSLGPDDDPKDSGARGLQDGIQHYGTGN